MECKLEQKNFLASYDLDLELFKLFGLTVFEIVPVRNVFYVSTQKGEKILKKINYSLQELNYINSVIKYIKRKFHRIIDFEENIYGEIFTLYKGNVYCIMNLIVGRECQFENPLDLEAAARGVAMLHEASLGFRTDYLSKVKNGVTIKAFIKRTEEISIFKKIALLHEIKTEFDEIFLENVDENIKEMERSIRFLEASAFYKLASSEDKVAICHHDLAHHNILINKEEAYFVDFDYAIVDLRVHDLCNLINKAMKILSYDFSKYKLILDSYNLINELSDLEKTVLKGMLYFPDDFYSISRDYYTKRKDWSEDVFVFRLKKKILMKEDRKEFIGSL